MDFSGVFDAVRGFASTSFELNVGAVLSVVLPILVGTLVVRKVLGFVNDGL